MQTILDSRHELELNGLKYDGDSLVAEVVELVVGYRRRVVPGTRHYLVTFPRPVAHALTCELSAVVANWIQGNDTGFLRRIEDASLRAALGVDLHQSKDEIAYVLITAHEVLVVYCSEEPHVVERGA